MNELETTRGDSDSAILSLNLGVFNLDGFPRLLVSLLEKAPLDIDWYPTFSNFRFFWRGERGMPGA